MPTAKWKRRVLFILQKDAGINFQREETWPQADDNEAVHFADILFYSLALLQRISGKILLPACHLARF